MEHKQWVAYKLAEALREMGEGNRNSRRRV